MANEKILIFEAPWSPKIAETQATKDIYTSAETLLRNGPEPVRIIQRPLVSSTYLRDIEDFAALECNQRGPNFVVFSAHGSFSRVRQEKGGPVYLRRQIEAFDREINLSSGIQKVSESLSRTIIILDSCAIGTNIKSFYRASRAAGVIGFDKEEIDWVDSTMFILAVLLRFHSEDVMGLLRIRRTTNISVSRPQRVLESMTQGAWKSLAKALSVQYYFGP